MKSQGQTWKHKGTTGSQQHQPPRGLEAKLANEHHRSSHLQGRTRMVPRTESRGEGGVALLGRYSQQGDGATRKKSWEAGTGLSRWGESYGYDEGD